MKSIEYLAGLFDGEGSFSIQVNLRRYGSNLPSVHFTPTMSVNLYYGTEVLAFLQERFGGKVYPYKKGGNRWYLGRRAQVVQAARDLLSHLEIKRIICQRFLQALEMFPNRGGADQKAGERVWAPDVALAVAEIALSLNPPRSRKCNKTAEYLAEFRASLETEQTAAGYGHAAGRGRARTRSRR